jgi:formylmethanofuran dehydrogenase subunit D
LGYYDAYNAILSVTKSTPRDSIVDLTKRVIVNDFKFNPAYYQVQITTASTPLVSTTVDSWIVDDPNKVFEVKQISLIPKIKLNYGDLVYWIVDGVGDYWLTTVVDYEGDMYYRGSMQKCYSSLKWLDENGEIKEAYFTVMKDSQRGLGVVEGNLVILSNERRFIAVQNNADTSKITKGQRFIFDGSRAWKVTSLDTLSTGIIHFELEEHAIDESIDNVSLRIANYLGNIANYTIHILNGGNVSLQANKTLQINTEVKNNGNIVSVPITYLSDSPSVATVDSSGLITTISNGNATIMASVTAQPSVSDLLALTVQFTTVPNYTVEIVGDSYISKTTSKTYNITVKNNGVVDNSRTVSWNVYADDGTSATNLVSINSQSTTQITLQGNSIGYVKLKATLIGASGVNDVMRIQIKKLV